MARYAGTGTGARPPAAGREAGFSLIEVVVSVGVIGTVMAALTSFFVGANAISKQQGDSQAAVQVTVEATERVRALRGSELAKGRDQASTNRQWSSPPPRGVAEYLATMEKVYDSTAAALPVGAASPAQLPTTVEKVERNGVTYDRHFYLGACWQPVDGQLCEGTAMPGHLAFFRVVVAVTWPSRHCPDGVCTQLTATLVSSSPNEPVFNPNAKAPPPAPQNPGPQVGQQDVAVDLQLVATDGVPPLTWVDDSGLPAGLSLNASGQITGVPTTVGTYSWTATVRDADGRSATTPATSWTVRARPQVTGPGDRSTISGTAVSVTATMTGGTAPFTWTASNLPAGLSMSSSGVISGAPARPGPDPVTRTVRVTVTDNFNASASRDFAWTVIPALQVETPLVAPLTKPGDDAAVQMVATGGSKPYVSWTATGLPNGLSINGSGLITGKPQGAGTYSVTVSVTDSAGTTVTTGVFQWLVANKDKDKD